MTPQEAQRIVDSEAWRSLIERLAAAAAGTVAVRSGLGIVDQLRQAARSRADTRKEKSDLEIRIPVPVVKASSDPKLPRPNWFYPLLAVGTPLASAGGWMAVGAVTKALRKRRLEAEVAAAKKEFERALLSEQKTKFAADLDEVAQAYARGELDALSEKRASNGLSDYIRSLPSLYYTIALPLALIGAYGGWRLTGDSRKNEDLKAFQEATRRRQIARPLSLKARPVSVRVAPDAAMLASRSGAESNARYDVTTRKDTEATRDEPASKRASTHVKRALWPALRRYAGHIGSGLFGALASGMLLSKTAPGRWYLSGRVNDVMKDPQFLNKQLDTLMRDPRFVDDLYQRLAPALQRQFAERNPVLGQFVNFA